MQIQTDIFPYSSNSRTKTVHGVEYNSQ